MVTNSAPMDTGKVEIRARFVDCDEAYENPHHDHDHDHELKLKFSPNEIIRDLKAIDWSRVKWPMTLLLAILHIATVHGLYMCVIGQVKLITLVATFLLCFVSGIGTTMGAHRLWAHRSYSATPLTRFVLMLAHTMTLQDSIYTWTIDHRIHHKHTDTDADHTNIRRGFFYAHVGHLMYEIHPDLIEARRKLDASDLLEDPIVRFQHKFYPLLAVPIGLVLPVCLGPMVLGESWHASLIILLGFRLFFTYHITFSTGSFSHFVGYKPYDNTILATEHPFWGVVALGEGWHNYHHAFPYDYRASEFSQFTKNPTTAIIEFCSRFGLTYNLKRASEAVIRARMKRTGDQSILSNARKL